MTLFTTGLLIFNSKWYVPLPPPLLSLRHALTKLYRAPAGIIPLPILLVREDRNASEFQSV